MVVKMMKWSPFPAAASVTKKFQVKVKCMKLEGFYGCGGIEDEGLMKVEMVWKGPKVGLPPLRRITKQNVSKAKVLRNGCDVEWDDDCDEFENVCSFLVKDGLFIPWDVSIKFLHGQNEEMQNKFVVAGMVKLNIAELASEMDAEIERKVAVGLQVAGVASEAFLLITMNFIEIQIDSPELIQEASEQEKEVGFLRKLTRYGYKKKKKKIRVDECDEQVEDQVSCNLSGDTDESTTFESDGSPDNYDLGPMQQAQDLVKHVKEEESSIYYGTEDKEPSQETQLGSDITRSDSTPKLGFWKKRRLSFRSPKRKDDSACSTTKTNGRLVENASSEHDSNHEELSLGSWEEKELISRDGHSKLKANVFFASIDQRSEKASGESACTALVTVIADWLEANQDKMPTKSQFDSLIIEGSSEWRKLCGNEAYIQRFPDKHFDLETVLEANLRPLNISSHKSFIGFFCPERFESLKGAMSIDEIWNAVRSNVEEGASHIYIVSWNDHFFVMKVQAGTYYIIDTLGERLFEGCNQAYILKFNDTSEILKLPMKGADSTSEKKGVEPQDKEVSSSIGEETEECEELVCKGKECCLEFLKRFLAAIPLKELEMEEEKGTASTIALHQRLQIEFHFSSSDSSSSSSSCP